MMNQRLFAMISTVLGVIAAVSCSGCSHADAQPSVKAEPKVRSVPVTVAPLERKTVERTVNVVGSLRGWEQVTVGSKRIGSVHKVLHDMGDRVQPGEPLVELEPIDAQLAYNQAQSKYLAELMKLDITEARAEWFVKQYGISEELIRNQHVDEAIDRVPAVKQIQVDHETRPCRTWSVSGHSSRKGASTQQELDDCENEYRSACAAYDNAKATARTSSPPPSPTRWRATRPSRR